MSSCGKKRQLRSINLGRTATFRCRRGGGASFSRSPRLRGSITVTDIASEFAVSADTIRRDLDYLASRGLLTRTHGGAVPVDGFVDRDTPVALRVNARAAEKARIARAAAALIADGETLIVNGGSTTRAFVGELGALRNLTIVTNNLGVPAVVLPNTTRGVYLLGGHVRLELQVTIGAVGFADAGPISADTAIIGVGGVSARGLSTTMLEELTMITAMMEFGAPGDRPRRFGQVRRDGTRPYRAAQPRPCTGDRRRSRRPASPPPSTMPRSRSSSRADGPSLRAATTAGRRKERAAPRRRSLNGNPPCVAVRPRAARRVDSPRRLGRAPLPSLAGTAGLRLIAELPMLDASQIH